MQQLLHDEQSLLMFQYQLHKSESVDYTPRPTNHHRPSRRRHTPHHWRPLHSPPFGERSPLAVPIARLGFGVQLLRRFRPAAPPKHPIHSISSSVAPKFGEVSVEHNRKHTGDQRIAAGIPARRSHPRHYWVRTASTATALLCCSRVCPVCPLPGLVFIAVLLLYE